MGIINTNDNSQNPEYNSKNRKVASSLRRTEHASEDRGGSERKSRGTGIFLLREESENAGKSYG